MVEPTEEITVHQWFADEVALMGLFMRFAVNSEELKGKMIKGDWHEQYEAWVSAMLEDTVHENG